MNILSACDSVQLPISAYDNYLPNEYDHKEFRMQATSIRQFNPAFISRAAPRTAAKSVPDSVQTPIPQFSSISEISNPARQYLKVKPMLNPLDFSAQASPAKIIPLQSDPGAVFGVSPFAIPPVKDSPNGISVLQVPNHYPEGTDACQFEQLDNLISKSQSILITAHSHPDWDAIGSTLAMYHALKLQGKDAVVCFEEKQFREFDGLPGVEMIRKKIPNKKFDLVLVLDVNEQARTSLGKNLPANVPVAVIDHHQSDPKIPFGNLRVLAPEHSSAGELLFWFINHCSWKVDLNTLSALYAAIRSDTGGFKFPSVDAHTFMAGTELLRQGVDHSKIATLVQDNKSEYYFDTLKQTLYSRQFEPNTGLTYAAVNQGSASAATSLLEQARGVRAIAAFNENTRYNTVSISLRSKSSVNVAEVAERFGGGGHTRAAGIKFQGALSDIQSQVIPILRDHCIFDCELEMMLPHAGKVPVTNLVKQFVQNAGPDRIAREYSALMKQLSVRLSETMLSPADQAAFQHEFAQCLAGALSNSDCPGGQLRQAA